MYNEIGQENMMPWKISYIEDLKIIQTVYTQPSNLEELKEAVFANLNIAKEKQTGLFLADCSSFTESGKTMDIYELGNFLELVTKDIKLNIKEAMIEPLNAKSVGNDLRFFETVAQNRMIKVRVFHNINDAIDWLVN